MSADKYEILKFSTIFFLFSANLYADSDKYLCIADQAVGFKYTNGENKWQRTFFRVNDKYIISKCSDLDKKGLFTKSCDYKITEIGKSYALCGCQNDEHIIICDCGVLIDFRFFKSSGRYIHAFLGGYWNSSNDKESDTPFLEIGNCSPF